MNQNNSKILIAFTGGGTGGHIYPGISIITELQKQISCRIIWIGSKKGVDKNIVEKAGIEFFGISTGKLRRYFSFENFIDIFKFFFGIIKARKILKKQSPVLLFSKGGFVSVPSVIAAKSLKIPVWTHESDFTPGLATKINSYFANKICVSYENTYKFFGYNKKGNIIYTGNPIRSGFYSADAEKGLEFLGVSKEDKILLILGGSQGAKEINELIVDCIDELTKHFFVVHQTGEQTGTTASSRRYKRITYIGDEMPDVLAAASLVIGRSGAGTIWECAASACPMILIPLCGSGTRGDQVENAHFFEEKGAAITLIHPDKNILLQTVFMLTQDEKKLQNMANTAKMIGAVRGADIVIKNMILYLKDNNLI
ncbi:UDP-N-acetylglucosamine--N-acetylmuramyl-(pentapeptide) pyrophosphoryl-undecaprenol N-acetylglucosamine transferase [Spirochaetia bacterium]|nr:UDP-N-acetylglucosamine--N-acetylmuramyl-(pentapeptide) pyrophosphoryl-undecaprenol N-acetylglucosamine transferase [Spirochaetia bacterium]